MEHAYKVDLTYETGRRGVIRAADVAGGVVVATPPPFPKAEHGFWSPEHLFTAAVSSCFMTTFLAVAENSKLDFVKLEVAASGRLSDSSGKYLMEEITLYPKLVILDEGMREKAMKVMEKSEKACLISNSIKSSVSMMPEIVIAS